jgi:hypothetical protein
VNLSENEFCELILKLWRAWTALSGFNDLLRLDNLPMALEEAFFEFA